MRVRRLAALVAVVGVAALSAGSAASAPTASPSLAPRLAQALTVPSVAPRSSAAVALDLSSDRVVFALNGSLPLVPASTEKLLVTYAALASLGHDYRIETSVLGDDEISAGVWRGDIVLKGSGDPTLSSADLRYLAGRIRALGVRTITGRVVGDETYFDSRRTGAGWKSYFFLNESAALSALTVDRTRYRGVLSRQPALAAAHLFREALRARGIQIRGVATVGRAGPTAVPVAATESAPLASILRFMNRESDNFTAEILLKQLGAVDFGRGTAAHGAVAVRRLLAEAHVPLAGVRIVDGSGLSPLNRLTANALIGVLRAAWVDPTIRRTIVAAMPVAGRTGTLERRMRGSVATGAVFAKTGSTSVSSALSGFVRTRYAFAVIQNGRPVSHYWARRAQDRFATVLAREKG